MKKKNIIEKIRWRRFFVKIKISKEHAAKGHCWKCHANDSCTEYYCPCKKDEQLRLRMQ